VLEIGQFLACHVDTRDQLASLFQSFSPCDESARFILDWAIWRVARAKANSTA
jgi:hypothetical protein